MLKYTCTIPMPPSVNGLYATDFRTKRRFKSKAYVTWEALIGILPERPINPIECVLKAEYGFGKPRAGKIDVASYEKATSDLLVAQGIIQDDSLIHDLRLFWDPTVPKGMVRVTLTAL